MLKDPFYLLATCHALQLCMHVWANAEAVSDSPVVLTSESMQFEIGGTGILQKLQVHQKDVWASCWAAFGESALESIAILTVFFVTRFFLWRPFCGRLILPLFALVALRVHAPFSLPLTCN